MRNVKIRIIISNMFMIIIYVMVIIIDLHVIPVNILLTFVILNLVIMVFSVKVVLFYGESNFLSIKVISSRYYMFIERNNNIQN